MHRCQNLLLLLVVWIGNVVHGDIEDLVDIPLQELPWREPLFVSLGSHCHIASILRSCSLRKAAFPFDWIHSFDGEALIEILEQDFLYFLDEEFLAWDFSGRLSHASYHLEFVHEGIYLGEKNYNSNLPNFKTKYQRRIDRFRDLGNYSGKVYFVRIPFPHRTEPFVNYSLQDLPLEKIATIPDLFALRLYLTLQNRFPKLNLHLIAINWHDSESIEERMLTDRIHMVRCSPAASITRFQEYFSKLTKE